MPRPRTEYLARLVAAFAVIIASLAIPSNQAMDLARGAQGDTSVAQKVPIYVSDFELIASTAAHRPKKSASQEADSKHANLVYADTHPASVQAHLVVDAFANTLVELLQKDGYTATRQKGKAPSNGVLLRGVFAEADDKNRIRRAILGGGSLGPQFILYVGTFNLARQDQPLYQVAPVQSPDPRYGPVITLNTYIPLAKFNVDKNPSGEDVRKICEEIVSQLAKLLNANPTAVSE